MLSILGMRFEATPEKLEIIPLYVLKNVVEKKVLELFISCYNALIRQVQENALKLYSYLYQSLIYVIPPSSDV